MKTQMFNYDYLQFLQEFPLILKTILTTRRTRIEPSNNILLVNSCVIGDFISSLHAIRTFIRESPSNVDLVVSSPMKRLAGKIRGVRKIYTAKTLLSRPTETDVCLEPIGEAYDLIIVMRASRESCALLKGVRFSRLRTSFSIYIPYFLNLMTCLVTKREMIPYWEVNFEIFDREPQRLEFDEIFDFSEEDHQRVQAVPALTTTRRIVLIHTGSGWRMKKWTDDKWVDLIKRVNALGEFRFVFVGHAEEEATFRELRDRLDFEIFPFFRQDLADLLLAMRHSDFFIGVDSGPRNMAHLADLRSITIAGPDPLMFPAFNDKDIIIVKGKKCDGRQLLFASKTPHIDKVEVSEVYEAFLRLLET